MLMEQVFEACGYNFHVLTIGEHKYWIGKELVHAFGFELFFSRFNEKCSSKLSDY